MSKTFNQVRSDTHAACVCMCSYMLLLLILVIRLQNSENEALSKAISGIIWELKDKYKRQEKAGNITILSVNEV